MAPDADGARGPCAMTCRSPPPATSTGKDENTISSKTKIKYTTSGTASEFFPYGGRKERGIFSEGQRIFNTFITGNYRVSRVMFLSVQRVKIVFVLYDEIYM